MLEQARKFKFDALLTFLDESFSQKLSLSPPSTFIFLFLSNTLGKRASFYHTAIRFEAELPNVNQQMRLHVAGLLRGIIKDSADNRSRGEEHISIRQLNKRILRNVIENGSPDFFKKLLEDLMGD